MISYYVYGRGKEGYIKYNPDFSKSEEDMYFLKMADYTQCTSDIQDMPEKIFCYRFLSEKNGDCTVLGQTSLVRGLSTRLSGDRDTVFSFQYLLSGGDQRKLWENVPTMSRMTPFPVNMDQVCSEESGKLELESCDLVQNAASLAEEREGSGEQAYSTEELLDYFSIDERKLTDLFYALLLFNTTEKIYIMLPDNTKHSTQMAFALMQRILSFLPYSIQLRTGFVTYVNRAESSVGDYVLYEIRCMFLANTEDNQKLCRNTKTAFAFCEGCETGVNVPDELRELVQKMAASFLQGEADENIRDLWNALDSYLKPDANAAISTLEYKTLYDFCRLYRCITQAPDQVPGEQIVWDTVDVLRSMCRERTQLWNGRLAEDSAQFVKDFVQSDIPSDRDDCRRMIEEYENNDYLREAIEDFFCRKVGKYGQLEEYLRKLSTCPELQRRVSDRCIDLLHEQLANGKVDDSLIPMVLSQYEDHPELQGTIQSYFADNIVDSASLEKYRGLIQKASGSGNEMVKLWSGVEQQLYADSNKRQFLEAEECRNLQRILSNQKAGVEERIEGFWRMAERLKKLNASILADGNYLSIARDLIPSMFAQPGQPRTICRILQESERKLKSLSMPAEYTDLFSRASENYIRENNNRILQEYDSPDMLEKWPFVNTKSRDVDQVMRALSDKSLANEKADQFGSKLRHERVREIHAYLKGLLQGDEATLNYLRRHPDIGDDVVKFTKRLEKEACADAKKNYARENFCEICSDLLTCFPGCTEQILDYVMLSKVGGVAPLSKIYSALKENGLARTSGRRGSTGLNRDMADALKRFFARYKMSGVDKKEIKQEIEFINKIGLDMKTLKNL